MRFKKWTGFRDKNEKCIILYLVIRNIIELLQRKIQAESAGEILVFYREI